MKTVATALALALAAVAAPAAAVETVSVNFTSPTGGQSAGLWSGIVKLRVEGTGFSNGGFINDAFYNVGNAALNTGYYALGFGTAPLAAFTPSNNIQSKIVGGVPAYDASHIYTFLLNTGAAVPSTLYFGVTDGQYNDNGGSFRVTISNVPEPANWAMLIAGFGLVGAAARRRRSVVSA
jgi:PEP-CTERM motif